MLLTEVGGVIYAQSIPAAVQNSTPLADRSLLARRITIANPSASDDWQIISGGKEIMRVRELSVGNQHLFRTVDVDQRPKPNFWGYCRNVLGLDATIPVPKGQTLTIQSVGGATADIVTEFKEVQEGDAAGYPVNHFMKSSFLLPIGWRLNASQAAAGFIQLDTQTAPPWVPALFSNTNLPVNWRVELLALFVETGGVNTFSGAANHQSTILDLHVLRNQSQWYSRAGHGIPAAGSASAAGSANTVFTARSGMFRPFEIAAYGDDNLLPVPIVLTGGETMQLLWDIVGDLTGGASYANFLVWAIAKLTLPAPVGGYA